MPITTPLSRAKITRQINLQSFRLWLLQNSAVPHPGRKEMTWPMPSYHEVIIEGRVDSPKIYVFQISIWKKHGLYKKKDGIKALFLLISLQWISSSPKYTLTITEFSMQKVTSEVKVAPSAGTEDQSLVFTWWSTSNVTVFFWCSICPYFR